MAMRTHYCGLVTEALLGQTVTLCGWVNRRRDHGGVIFVDVRDREGYVQVVCDPDRADMFKVAEEIRNEYCVQIKGLVRARPEGTTNDGLKSGNINLSISTTANASSFIKKYGILSVSYLFTDEKHFARVLSDPQFLKLFDEMTAEAKPGFRRAGLITPGARHYYSNKGPIASIDDLKQIKMRVMASPVESKVWGALGTSPLAMSMTIGSGRGQRTGVPCIWPRR